ncbi:MAG TPA: hypothetical protein VK681_39255 [Reyranella sp.]|nr:hypothetical protein [Reyranella sp.]
MRLRKRWRSRHSQVTVDLGLDKPFPDWVAGETITLTLPRGEAWADQAALNRIDFSQGWVKLFPRPGTFRRRRHRRMAGK